MRERLGGDADRMAAVFGRISFFVNAGVRFVEEHAKLRAMSILCGTIGRERYGVADPQARRFRYGVQVNSLGLTEPQPENNVQRIVLEALAVTLGRDARARAIQLPAWNEALGLPRPVGPAVVAAHPAGARLRDRPARVPRHLRRLDGDGGLGRRAPRRRPGRDGGGRRASAARSSAVPYMKAALVDSHRERIRRIEAGEQTVVGVNRFTETEASPLTADARAGSSWSTPAVEAERWPRSRGGAAERDAGRGGGTRRSRGGWRPARENIMPASIAAARAGVTTGEWAQALRDCFGDYRAPTGVGQAAAGPPTDELDAVRGPGRRGREPPRAAG